MSRAASATGTPLVAVELTPPAPSQRGVTADVENDGDRGPRWGSWRAPPRRCPLVRVEARIGNGQGHKLHVEIACDAAGKPCAIRIDLHKEGSAFRGMLDAIGLLASQALQHGASIHEVAGRLRGVRFEPDGAVQGHETITECTSVVDLVGRMIEAEYPVEGAPCRCVACR